jgi:hypothetical protein
MHPTLKGFDFRKIALTESYFSSTLVSALTLFCTISLHYLRLAFVRVCWIDWKL